MKKTLLKSAGVVLDAKNTYMFVQNSHECIGPKLSPRVQCLDAWE